MKRRHLLGLALTTGLACSTLQPAQAAGKVWKVSIAQLPVYSESAEKGVLVDFVKALERVSGDKIEISVVPFARSVNDAVEKKSDFSLPTIEKPGQETGTATFDYATETVLHVNFVMYSTKGVNITPATAGKFKVETEASHAEYFEFPIASTANIESSLKKVNAGRIDAFIFADNASDPIVKGGDLKNVKRQLYKRFNSKIVLPKGARNGPTDKWLTENIAKIRASGELAKIMGGVDAAYNDWQP